LARRRVILSRRVIAYYGLIRASGPLQSAYRHRRFRRLVFALRPLARRSLLSAANPSRRATSRTPADRMALDDSTSIRDSLRPNAMGSASATSHLNRNTWVPFRGCRIRLMLRPDELLALLRQGRLRSSFHSMSHLAGTSNMTTRANRQFPAAGLSPAGLAALQAGRVAPGGCPPGAPTDPYVLALEHTVPRITHSHAR